MACIPDYYRGGTFIVFGSIWISFLAWWTYNTWWANSPHAKSIQKLIFFVLLFRGLYMVMNGCGMIFCESENSTAYWELGTSTTFTLYNTFLFTVMNLMSKGFCILRETLDRNEVTSVAIVMGLVYLGFSAILLEIKSSVVLLIILGALFLTSVRSTIESYKILQYRHNSLQEANILVLLPNLQTKIKIMKKFLLFSYLFYLNEIMKISLYCIGSIYEFDSTHYFWEYIDPVHMSLATLTCLAIFWLFRAKPRWEEFGDSLLIHHPIMPIANIFYADVERNYGNFVEGNKPVLVLYENGERLGILYLDDKMFMVGIPIA